MKNMKKFLSVFLAVLMLFTTFSLVMPVFAVYENVTSGNATDGNVSDADVEKEKEAKILSEITEKRDKAEKHFLMSDGTFMVAQYSQPVHYQNSEGKWIDYDNTIKEVNATTELISLFGTDEIYSTGNQIENVLFAKKSNSNTLVSYEAKDYPISLNYQSAKKSNIKIIEKKTELQGNDAFLTLPNLSQEVLYENVFTGVNLQYIVSTEELKENIILKNKNALNTFTVNYNIGSLTAEVVDSRNINLMAGEELIYTISAPYMYDAAGEKSENVTLTVEKNKNGKLTVVITADNTWIQAEDRIFPVTIDPSIITKTTRDVIDSVMIAEACENENFSQQSEMIVGRETSKYGYCRVLSKFDIPVLNKGDVIVDAKLCFLNYGLWPYSEDTPDMQVNAHRITQDWDVTSVTWNNKPSYDSIISDYDIFEELEDSAEWRYFDITKMVKYWYENPEENFGVMLKGANTTGTYAENGVKAYMYTERYNEIESAYPSIVITYRNNKGLEDYWTYTSLSAGVAGSAYINDYTGNLVVASNAVSTSNELMPLSIDCIYNGYVSGTVGFVGKNESNKTWLGRGWRFSVQQTLISSSFYGLTGDSKTIYPYVYTDGDGTEHYIYYDEDKEIYEDEDGLGLTLTFDEEHNAPEWYLLTDKKDNTLKFNINGNLVESKDANGNKITITYNGYKISKVTDGSGKEYIFSYTDENHPTATNYIRYILHPSGEKTKFYYNSVASLIKIVHVDGTVSNFTYEGDGDRSMLTVKDNENYQLSFEYTPLSSGKQVKKVTEYGNGTEGQKITFDRTKYNTTKIQTAGTDGIYGNSNDLITTYQFDNFGKTVTQQLSTDGGVSSVAGVYEYTEKDETSLKTANKVTSAASLGRNVVNLVANGNAESLSNWTEFNSNATSSISASTDAAYIGSKSILVNTTAISAVDGTANVRQNVNGLVSGKYYTLSAYVKTTNMIAVNSGEKTGAYIGLRTIDGNGNKALEFSEFVASDTSASINKGWRRLVVTVQLPEGCTYVQFYLGVMNATGKAYFDCIQLEEGSIVNDYNLVENASFEKHSNGMPIGWTASNTEYTVVGSTVKEGITASYKKEGNYSMRFSGEATEKKHVFQRIAVGGNVNDTYILSGWAIANATKKAEHHENPKFHIYIRITYDNGENGTYQEWKDPLEFNADIPGQWQYSAKAFTLKSKEHPAYKPLYVDISTLYNYQINGACFDNIQLIKDVAQSYVYDDEGNIVSVSANAEQKDSMEYDAQKEDLKKYTDALGYETNYTYDTKHNLTSVKSPGRTLTDFTYNSNGNQTKTFLKSEDSNLAINSETWYTNATTQNNDNGTAVTVKKGSYVAGTSDEHGNKTYYFYNIIKDLTRGFKNVLDVITEYVYDDTTEQLKTVKTYKKDADGNNVVLSSPVNYTYSGTKLSTINYGTDTYRFSYDNFGNVISTSVGGKALSTNTYGEKNGVLQSTSYGNGAVKNYTYDAYGNLTGVGNGGSTVYRWYYDSAMNPMIHRDAVNNLRYNYEYDGIGRLIRQELRSYDNSLRYGATEYTYDLRNNVTKIANEMGGRTVNQWYYYTAVDGVENSARYAKENLPVRYYMSSSRHLSYNYDSLNRLNKKTLSTNTPLISTYSYKMSDRDAVKDEGDTNSYRTTQVSTEHSNKLVYYYEYDVAGNITNIKRAGSDGAGNRNTAWTNNYRSYTYDDLCQLTSETNATTGKTYTYTYDNTGNITSKSDGTSTITYTYGTDSDAGWSKLLTSYNGETIDYDSIGNPTTYRGANLTWNGRQLNSYSKNGTSISYTYDADGLRGSKTINGAKSTYHYVDGTLLYEDRNGTDLYYYYDSYGTITAIAAYLPNGASGYVFVGTNSLGDVNALYNANGEMIVKYEYDAWGRVLAETDKDGNPLTGTSATWNELNPFRYRGYYYDGETELYYINSRYYDAEVGRFISADDVDVITASLDMHTDKNLFAYCDNNPVIRKDTSGAFWDIVFDIVSWGFSAAEVIANPNDAKAWIGFALDTVDLAIPCLGGLGEAYKAYRGVSRTLDYAGDTVDTFRHLDNVADVAKSSKKGWKVGDDIANLTKAGTEPKWSTVRQRYWKNEALNDSSYYFGLHPDNKIRMQNGKAPLVECEKTGKYYSYELHHKNPVRNGGKHTYDNLQPLTPWDHAIEDSYRHFKP